MGYDVKKRETEDVGALAKKTAGIVSAYLKKNREVIMKSLPEGFNFDRMCRVVVNAIYTTPELAKCSAESLFLSTVRAFSLGLEPNGTCGEGYLVPFWNSQKSCLEAQFMPGYRGLQALARRSGEIAEIYSKVVCRNDIFDVEEGTERKIIHKPDYKTDRGESICYYAVFRTKSGNIDFEVMSQKEIERVHASSKAGEGGPWSTWYDEMAKKTVMKRLLKRAPMSVEKSESFKKAIDAENRVAMGEEADNSDILDIEGLEVPDESDTPAEVQKTVNAERAEALKEKIAEKKGSVDAPDKLRSEIIAGLLHKSNAPVTMAQFIAYCRDTLRIADIDDIPAWGATENRRFMESPEAYVSEIANKIADSLI